MDLPIDDAPVVVTPRRGNQGQSSRTTVRSAARVGQQNSQTGIQYFRQVLDIETVCANALRSIRQENNSNEKWLDEIMKDEWMYSFDVPIKIKF